MTPDRATVFADIAAEVEIPTDGTLSRVLLSDDRVRVVVFAFDEGQELTEHTAAVPAIVQVIRGRMRLALGTEVTNAGPGAWAYMAANLPHSILALEPSVLLLTMLKGS
jgi:quercetin dioxygenase-like cupin family protein